MKMVHSLIIGTVLAVGAVTQADAQDITIPSVDDVRSYKGMIELGFINSLSEKALEKIRLTDEQIADIELRLAEAQARIPAAGTVDLEHQIAADVAAHLEVEDVLTEHLTADQLAVIKERVDPETVGKPYVVGKPDGVGKPAGMGKPL